MAYQLVGVGSKVSLELDVATYAPCKERSLAVLYLVVRNY